MNTYTTARAAAAVGVHPNTVRLYEKLELIPKPERRPNGYRVFTELHIEHLELVRLAFQVEVLQNGLRKKIIQMIKTAAAGDYDGALKQTWEYVDGVRRERAGALEAIEIAREILSGKPLKQARYLKRKEASEYLDITVDALRNWEMNGLLTVKRRQNGYRVYTDEDMERLKIIRCLRRANYSLEAILRMLSRLSKNPAADIKLALETPDPNADVVTVCDRLCASLTAAEENALRLIKKLEFMKEKYS